MASLAEKRVIMSEEEIEVTETTDANERPEELRLLEALSQLAVGRSVTAVAMDVGYRSPSSFTAMFRRTFGVTPSHYYSAAEIETGKA